MIREVELKDFTAIETIDTNRQIPDYVKETYTNGGVCFIYSFRKDIIGYVAITPNKDKFINTYVLDDILIKEEYRKMGIGTKLMQFILGHFGNKDIYLFVDDMKILAWYKKFKFELVYPTMIPNLISIGNNGYVMIRKACK